MLKCKDCKFSRKVPGSSHHMQCIRGSTLVLKPNERAIEKGWFTFPFNFDPIWAENCTGFVDKEICLKKLSRQELLILLQSFIGNLMIHSDRGYKGVLDKEVFLSKISLFLSEYEKKKKNGLTKQDLIYIIELSWTI